MLKELCDICKAKSVFRFLHENILNEIVGSFACLPDFIKFIISAIEFKILNVLHPVEYKLTLEHRAKHYGERPQVCAERVFVLSTSTKGIQHLRCHKLRRT